MRDAFRSLLELSSRSSAPFPSDLTGPQNEQRPPSACPPLRPAAACRYSPLPRCRHPVPGARTRRRTPTNSRNPTASFSNGPALRPGDRHRTTRRPAPPARALVVGARAAALHRLQPGGGGRNAAEPRPHGRYRDQEEADAHRAPRRPRPAGRRVQRGRRPDARQRRGRRRGGRAAQPPPPARYGAEADALQGEQDAKLQKVIALSRSW